MGLVPRAFPTGTLAWQGGAGRETQQRVWLLPSQLKTMPLSGDNWGDRNFAAKLASTTMDSRAARVDDLTRLRKHLLHRDELLQARRTPVDSSRGGDCVPGTLVSFHVDGER